MNMQNKTALTAIAAGLMAVALAAPAQDQQDKTIFELGAEQAKQTSKNFKPAPAKLKTNFGTLEFTGGGYPTKETAQKVYDELDLQRATQAYLDFYPALSLYGML